MKKIVTPNRIERLRALFNWLAFSVFIAFLPLVSAWTISQVTKTNFSIELALSHGELLLISIGIVGEASGQLFSSVKKNSGFNALIGFGCVVVILSCSVLFGVVSIAKGELDTSFIMKYSIIMFIISLVAGGSSKWMEK